MNLCKRVMPKGVTCLFCAHKEIYEISRLL